MNSYLYIMRHAKSDWSGPQTSDFERPINGRGRRNSVRIGQWMSDNNYIPQRNYFITGNQSKRNN